MKRSDITDEQVVAACRAYHKQGLPFSLDRLIESTGAPEKVAYAAMGRACARGLIDYGVSLRSAWPTD
ncbi:hypothetical protein ACJBUE_20780 (plasmid) [Ralstonia syzygii subsp. celebesensis]|uniref:Uncharacterized protein n=1 Tax=blood disease bacterium R229 TaxID=741978 RepID=G2ZVX1_9RALS|nr:hypothetical protein [Ralstonia syzygii]QQV57835.1 hypothetical protein JK151_20625 [Ralstonia syzygii subsp. celebesensis]CCA83252.1 hypothetical protein BDB_mp60418 [blood disease bacterium R229]